LFGVVGQVVFLADLREHFFDDRPGNARCDFRE
jgi:hypothetical protein